MVLGKRVAIWSESDDNLYTVGYIIYGYKKQPHIAIQELLKSS